METFNWISCGSDCIDPNGSGLYDVLELIAQNCLNR